MDTAVGDTRRSSMRDERESGGRELAGRAAEVMDNARELAQDVADQSKEAMSQRMTDAKARLAQMQTVAADKARQAAQTTDWYVREYRWIAVGIAAALGLALGLWTSANRASEDSEERRR